MKFSKSMQMLLRAPLKSLVTLLLIGAVTFGFFSQVCEYAVVSREMERLAEFYQVTGTVEAGEIPIHAIGTDDALITLIFDKTKMPAAYHLSDEDVAISMRQYAALSGEVREGIAMLPHVVSTQTRYMTAGVSDTYYRMDANEYCFNYNARLVGEGIVENTMLLDAKDGRGSRWLYITFSEFTALAGNPDWMPESVKKISARLYLPVDWGAPRGGGPMITRSDIRFNRNYLLGFEENIQSGDRLIFLSRISQVKEGLLEVYIGDITDYWCDELSITTNEPEDYLDTEPYAPYRLAMDITAQDLHTFDMVYLEDMMGIPAFADRRIAILEGRALYAADSGTGNCVVSHRFLTENGLAIGDTFPMALGDQLFETNASLGAIASIPERYALPVEKAELTIVGAYVHVESSLKQAELAHHTYNQNTIFVPLTLLPESANIENHEVKPGDFSYVLDHPSSVQAFETAAKDFLETNCVTLLLGSNATAWDTVSAGYNSSSAVTLMTILIFFVAEIATCIFVVYLYIGRRKREYSIMRILGVPGKDAGRALFVPLMALGLFAIAVGSGASWVYTTGAVEKLIAQYPVIAGYTYHGEIPPLAAAACVALSIVLLAVPAFILLGRLRKVQPLMLLQESEGMKTAKKAKAPIVTNMPMENTGGLAPLPAWDDPNTVPPPVAKPGFLPALPHVLRYVGRHSRRTAIKSLLSVLVPALLLGVIGQTIVMGEKYDELFHTIPLTGTFTERAPADQVFDLAAKPYLSSSYYSGDLIVRVETETAAMIVSNDLARYTKGADIQYGDGYDAASFQADPAACVLNGMLMDTFGLILGDALPLISLETYSALGAEYLGEYFDAYLENGYDTVDTGIEMLEAALVEIEMEIGIKNDETMPVRSAIASFYQAVAEASLTFTVAGRTDYAPTHIGSPRLCLVPAGTWYISFAGEDALFSDTEFVLSDNEMAETFKADGQRGASLGRDVSPYLQFSLDTAALDNVRRSRDLLTTLFPLILGAAVAIGALFQLLMILQLTKDVGTMRLLGTTATRAFAITALERMFLLILGCGLAAGGLLLYHGEALKTTASTLIDCGLLFPGVGLLAAALSALIVTRKSPLQSIQTKE